MLRGIDANTRELAKSTAIAKSIAFVLVAILAVNSTAAAAKEEVSEPVLSPFHGDIPGRRCWLGREAVTPARSNMKPVKIGDGLAVADDFRAYTIAFRFAYRTSHRACKATDQFFDAGVQIEPVPEEFGG